MSLLSFLTEAVLGSTTLRKNKQARQRFARNVRARTFESLERREVLVASLASSFIMPVPGGSDFVRNIAVDGGNNTYVAGTINAPAEGTVVDFDPTHSFGDNHDLINVAGYRSFVAKYNSAGELQWNYLADQDSSTNVTLGSLTNNVYVGLTGTTNRIGKLDAATGTLVWQTQVESATGKFVVDEQANPAISTRIYALSGQNISGYHFARINAYAVSAGGLSAPLWSAQTTYSNGGSAGWGSGASDIAVSPDHNSIYISGEFKGTVDFDPSGRTFKLSSGSSSQFPYLPAAFVWKLSSSGAFQWADAFTVGKSNSYSTAGSIKVDPSGNVIVAGQFYGTVDLDPGKGTLKPTSLGGADAYVAKLNPAGGLIYAKNFGTANHDGFRGMTLDANGDIYLSTAVNPTGQIDLKLDTSIIKISNAGIPLWYYAFGGTSYANGGGGTTNSQLVVKSGGTIQIIGDTYGDLYVADTPSPAYAISVQTIFWMTLSQ